MDDLTYNYITGTNQLDYVTDAATGTYSDDISGGQSTGNYTYDLIGNLISDNAEGINNITWNVYGKISSIDKVSGPDLTFAYDPMGNRIMKLVDDGSALIYTYYLRDAQGNVLSTYSRIDDATEDIITLSELHIYGSSRLGIMVEELDMSTTITSDGHSQRNLGKKRYELNNHLGNVLTVITDRRFGTEQGTTGLIKYYEADVLQAQDYYPFGMLTPGRNWSAGSEYRFGFNGKESDAETYGEGNAYDFGARIYDARLGRWMKVDPLQFIFPFISPYNFSANSPLIFYDMDGRKIQIIGDKDYRKQVKAALKQLAANSNSGREMIKQAIKADQTLVISLYSSERGIEVFNKGGNIAKLNWNPKVADNPLPSKDSDGKNPLESPAAITMAHELFHFVSWTNNNSTNSFIDENNPLILVKNEYGQDFYLPNTIPDGEVGAVDFENIVRAEMGYGLRYLYNGMEVFNKEISKNPKQYDINGIKFQGYYLIDKVNPTDYNKHSKSNTTLNNEELNDFEDQFNHKGSNQVLTIEEKE
ncbi:MAG: hypothetical protein IPL48_11085 [Bacteroidetes bacterium]|nr:hypothetical protein [Bacteroidota bacterium]